MYNRFVSIHFVNFLSDVIYDGEDWVFCYRYMYVTPYYYSVHCITVSDSTFLSRWVLLLFKRELELLDMFRLWEVYILLYYIYCKIFRRFLLTYILMQQLFCVSLCL